VAAGLRRSFGERSGRRWEGRRTAGLSCRAPQLAGLLLSRHRRALESVLTLEEVVIGVVRHLLGRVASFRL